MRTSAPLHHQPDLPGLSPCQPRPHGLRQVSWEPTRAAGLARLVAFLPRAGRAYAGTRNYDFGPDDRSNVSALSPWIRRRLLLESEVAGAAHARHGAAAEKFVAEVFWRTYWKGWLELRPGFLAHFDCERIAARSALAGNSGLRRGYGQATAGATGITCFDAWVEELVTTGWLHNHARMWFASIWIFTLRLPWQLGADFFFKHLLDADAASNTLSWRWVAGLHTPGKHYVARASNIAQNSGGRFAGQPGLADDPQPLPMDDAPRQAQPLKPAPAPPRGPVGLLLHDDDVAALGLAPDLEVTRIASLDVPCPAAAGSPAARFRAGALAEGLSLAAAARGTPADGTVDVDGLLVWARGQAVVAVPEAPQGLTAWALDRLEPALAAQGTRLVRLRRTLDAAAWPQARAGFFGFKGAIPQLLVLPD